MKNKLPDDYILFDDDFYRKLLKKYCDDDDVNEDAEFEIIQPKQLPEPLNTKVD